MIEFLKIKCRTTIIYKSSYAIFFHFSPFVVMMVVVMVVLFFFVMKSY